MKIAFICLFLLLTVGLCNAAELTSLNKNQFIKAFVLKTAKSISVDNLNGRTINNTFSMYLDGKGNIIGMMSQKPSDEPQIDRGVYSVNKNGTAYITWRHWDGGKKLCFHAFNTANAYVNVGCDNVFHTAFMKSAIKAGNYITRVN